MFNRNPQRRHGEVDLMTASMDMRGAMHLHALEARVLLDAAAAGTAAKVVADNPVHAEQAAHDAQASAAELAQALAHANPPAAPPAPEAQPTPAPVPVASAATPVATAAPATDLYFVDAALPDVQQLVAALPANAEVHYIAPGTDGIKDIAQAVQGRTGIASIQIISHGSAGELDLGTAVLTTASMQGQYHDDLVAIGRSLTANGDILLYGCDFGAGADGLHAMELLGNISGADIAASADTTGAAAFGGNWVLEDHTGPIEAQAVAAPDWDHVLAPPVQTVPSFRIIGTDTALIFSDANAISVSDADGDLSSTELTVTHGALNVVPTGGATISAGASGTQTLTISGTQAQINATLGTLTYLADTGYIGLDSLTVTSRDASAAASTDTIGIGVVPAVPAPPPIVPVLAPSAAAPIVLLAVNTMVNGSFETGSGTGWTGNAGFEVGAGSMYNPGAGAADGTLVVEVEGGFTGVPSYVEQSLATVVGQTYYYSIQASTRTQITVGDRGIMSINGAEVLRFTTGAAWTTYTVKFTATSTTTLVRITSDGSTSQPDFTYGDFRGPGDGVGLILDDVHFQTSDYATTYTENGAGVAIASADAQVLDNDSTSIASLRAIVSNGQAGDVLAVSGALPAGITASYNASTFTLTLSGAATLKDYQTALRAIRYSSTSENPSTVDRSISVIANDSTSDSTPAISTVKVIAVNDAPVNTIPASWTGPTNRGIPLTGLSVSDLDAASAPISVKLTASSGTLAATSSGVVGVSGSGSASVTLTGTLADIDAYLASASAPVFTATTGFTGVVNVTMLTNDNGNTGTGGALTDTDTGIINVTARVNEAPINAVPGAQTVAEDTSLPFTGVNTISVGDVDTNLVSTRLSVANGTLLVSLAGGATISAGANNSGTLTLSGTQAQINTALATLSYLGNANYNGPDTLTVLSTDAGTPALTDSDTVAINVTPVPDAPVNTVPGAQTVPEDSPLAFTGASLISVNDPDGDLATVQLSVGNGLLNLNLAGGATIVAGANGSGTLTLSGTQAQINAALALLTYQGNSNFNGNDTLTVRSTDGTSLTGTSTVPITVTPVPDDVAVSGLADGTVAGTDAQVRESALPGGSDAGGAGLGATGTFTLGPPANLTSLRINGGAPLTTAQLSAATPGAPITIVGAHGTLQITGYSAAGVATYTYTLTSAADHSGGTVNDGFVLTTIDADGDTTTPGTLAINILDDTPIARNDIDVAINIPGQPSSVAGGNVFTGAQDATDPNTNDGVADTAGADGPATPVVTGVIAGTGTPVAGNLGTTLAGTYGSVTLNSNGSYTYNPDFANATVIALTPGQQVTDVFTYQIRDGDGSPATATLSIDVVGVPSIVGLNDAGSSDGQVLESGLAGGSAPGAGQTLDGTFLIVVSPGFPLVTLTVGGTTFTAAELQGFSTAAPSADIVMAHGVLQLTGFDPASGVVDYVFTLNVRADHTGGQVFDSTTLSMTDAKSNNTAGFPKTLAIEIIDDAPSAPGDSYAKPIGTVVMGSNGTFVFTPAPGYAGTTPATTFTVSDGHGGETSGKVSVEVAPPPPVTVPEPEPPAPEPLPGPLGEAPVYRDFVFVYGPTDTAPATMRDVSFVPLEGAQGAVVAAVNGIDSLGGTELATSRMVTGDPSFYRPLASVIRDTALRDRTRFSLWNPQRTRFGGNELAVATSLRLFGTPGKTDVILEMNTDGHQILIGVDDASTGKAPVRRVSATLADGRPLPGWIRVDPSGLILIDPPAGTERISLRITVERRNGETHVHNVDIDAANTVMQERRSNLKPRGERRADAAGPVSPGDFASQLSQASSRLVEVDAELLDALG
ncbi:DUF4347 domain-containing protein [Variovorax sp. dw_308]|uniref:DUF4347 domain-containing protein n=1 Tax=Variovorax sp. dw_308 TaxID=2721546 RepID=UPI001C448BB7|nr:DUF4347 domain-containing protein [Variovorax sp. dw_308]